MLKYNSEPVSCLILLIILCEKNDFRAERVIKTKPKFQLTNAVILLYVLYVQRSNCSFLRRVLSLLLLGIEAVQTSTNISFLNACNSYQYQFTNPFSAFSQMLMLLNVVKIEKKKKYHQSKRSMCLLSERLHPQSEPHVLKRKHHTLARSKHGLFLGYGVLWGSGSDVCKEICRPGFTQTTFNNNNNN